MLPKNRPPIHPGKILLYEFLEPMGISQKQFAEHLKWPYARLNEIINEKRGVSADSALSFAESLNTTPEFWLNLQRNWDLRNARKKHIHIPIYKFKKVRFKKAHN